MGLQHPARSAHDHHRTAPGLDPRVAPEGTRSSRRSVHQTPRVRQQAGPAMAPRRRRWQRRQSARRLSTHEPDKARSQPGAGLRWLSRRAVFTRALDRDRLRALSNHGSISRKKSRPLTRRQHVGHEAVQCRVVVVDAPCRVEFDGAFLYGPNRPEHNAFRPHGRRRLGYQGQADS